jgi:hypothetical protein
MTTEGNVDRLESDGEARTLSNDDSTAVGVRVEKACCMCGVDLQGHTRYKDSSGRYWCPGCNEKDRLSKEPAVCPDCSANLTRADLQDFKGVAVCSGCWEKRRASARREEARMRAVEEEMRLEQERSRRWKIIIGSILLVILLWSAAYAVFWMMARS